MLNDAMNNLQINLFKGPDSLINFALPIKFDEHLSLPWPVRRIFLAMSDLADFTFGLHRKQLRLVGDTHSAATKLNSIGLPV